MVKKEKEKEQIPRLKQTVDGELVDPITSQCPCYRDKLR